MQDAIEESQEAEKIAEDASESWDNAQDKNPEDLFDEPFGSDGGGEGEVSPSGGGGSGGEGVPRPSSGVWKGEFTSIQGKEGNKPTVILIHPSELHGFGILLTLKNPREDISYHTGETVRVEVEEVEHYSQSRGAWHAKGAFMGPVESEEVVETEVGGGEGFERTEERKPEKPDKEVGSEGYYKGEHEGDYRPEAGKMSYSGAARQSVEEAAEREAARRDAEESKERGMFPIESDWRDVDNRGRGLTTVKELLGAVAILAMVAMIYVGGAPLDIIAIGGGLAAAAVAVSKVDNDFLSLIFIPLWALTSANWILSLLAGRLTLGMGAMFLTSVLTTFYVLPESYGGGGGWSAFFHSFMRIGRGMAKEGAFLSASIELLFLLAILSGVSTVVMYAFLPSLAETFLTWTLVLTAIIGPIALFDLFHLEHEHAFARGSAMRAKRSAGRFRERARDAVAKEEEDEDSEREGPSGEENENSGNEDDINLFG